MDDATKTGTKAPGLKPDSRAFVHEQPFLEEPWKLVLTTIDIVDILTFAAICQSETSQSSELVAWI